MGGEDSRRSLLGQLLANFDRREIFCGGSCGFLAWGCLRGVCGDLRR